MLSISVADVLVILVGYVIFGNNELAVSMSKKFAYAGFSAIFNITKTNIGPLLTNDNTLSDDPKVISKLLLHQYNRVF